MIKHFQRELEKIKKQILSLGALVEERVRMAVDAIEERDAEMAKKVIRLDHEIDEMEVEVEEECLKILALHQPGMPRTYTISTKGKGTLEMKSIYDLKKSLLVSAIFVLLRLIY